MSDTIMTIKLTDDKLRVSTIEGAREFYLPDSDTDTIHEFLSDECRRLAFRLNQERPWMNFKREHMVVPQGAAARMNQCEHSWIDSGSIPRCCFKCGYIQ
jgi:hypothetical protein